MSFKDQIVVITGAGSGIGAATAHAFARQGATVIASDINLENANAIAQTITENGGKAVAKMTNVAKYESVDQLISETVNEFGQLDVLVNNAGIGPRNLVKTHEFSFKDWDTVIAVNQTGVFYGMKRALEQMMLQKSGNIINIASLAGLKASGNNISYSASKFAVVGMTKSAALEYGSKNIRINAVCPGYTHSALLDSMFTVKPELEPHLKQMTPMKRYGKANEIADAILWLASAQSSYITGQTVTIDGGLSL